MAWQEGYPLKEIAIIYAQHKQIENILYLLEKKRNPLQRQAKSEHTEPTHHMELAFIASILISRIRTAL